MTYEVEVFDRKSTRSWNDIKMRVSDIEIACFGVNAYTPDQLRVDFNRRQNVSVLLWTRDASIGAEYLLGYTQATPDPDHSPEVWTVDNTAIDPAFQGIGLVAKLMAALYAELHARGCEFIERDAAIENGYADKLTALHKSEIIEQHDHDSKYGRQRFLRMRLPS